MSNKGWCVWITGLPGSGKSTIANALLQMLKESGISAQVVSSDMLREVITPDPKYTEEERDMVYGAIVFISKLLTENGVNVIIDATANRRKYRDKARSEIARFMEAYIRCPLGLCIEREFRRKRRVHRAPKAIYRKALSGASKTVPGIGVPYEEPFSPEVTVDSDKLSPDECAHKILETVSAKFLS